MSLSKNALIELLNNVDLTYHIPNRGFELSKKYRKKEIVFSILKFDSVVHSLVLHDKKETVFTKVDGKFDQISRQQFIQKQGSLIYSSLHANARYLHEALKHNLSASDLHMPTGILCNFERVGSTWLLDLLNEYARTQVEPLKLHFKFDSENENVDTYFNQTYIDDELKNQYDSFFFKNLVSNLYIPEMQILKETSLYHYTDLFLSLFPDNSKMLLLTRDVHGIISSIARNNLYEKWCYENDFKKNMNRINNSKASDEISFLKQLKCVSWIDKTIFLIALNSLSIAYSISHRKKEYIAISYRDLVLNQENMINHIKDFLNIEDNTEVTPFKTRKGKENSFNTNKVKSEKSLNTYHLKELEAQKISILYTEILKLARKNTSDEVYEIFTKLFYTQTTKSHHFISPNKSKYTSENSWYCPNDSTDSIINSVKYSHSNTDHWAQKLITYHQFISFVNQMESNGIKNRSNGAYLFINDQISTGRGGYLKYDDTKYLITTKMRNYPITWVNWIGARLFTSYIQADLPTYTQWEEYFKSHSNESSNTDYDIGNTNIVSKAIPDENGVFDFAGNVKIWTSDFYGHYSFGNSKITAGYAFNSRSNRRSYTYKQAFLGASTLGIRPMKNKKVMKNRSGFDIEKLSSTINDNKHSSSFISSFDFIQTIESML